MHVFPAEIIHMILDHLRPPISRTRADEANTKFKYDAWNWWPPRPVLSNKEGMGLPRRIQIADYSIGDEYGHNRDPRRHYLDILWYGKCPDVIWTEPLCHLKEVKSISLRFEGISADHETERGRATDTQPLL